MLWANLTIIYQFLETMIFNIFQRFKPFILRNFSHFSLKINHISALNNTQSWYGRYVNQKYKTENRFKEHLPNLHDFSLKMMHGSLNR